jgi:rhodanese-related sulfurtransferase
METVQNRIKEICPTTAQTWIKEGAILVDVREKDEVAKLAYDVPRIVHIPLSEFEERYAELPKDQNLVMVCAVGERSLRAANFLLNHGYEKVANMRPGIKRWVDRGFPTIGDKSSVGTSAGGACCAPATTEAPAAQEKAGACCEPAQSSEAKCC